ncbi:MAG TPA: thioredoxin family protein, partial [Chroococcales cyanobacterium]
YRSLAEVEPGSAEEQARVSEFFKALEGTLAAAQFKKLGLESPQEKRFRTRDGVELHGWLFAKPGASDTVLFSWAGTGDMRVPVLLGYVGMLNHLNLSVFVYDYRGMGKSGGKSTLTSAPIDGAAAYDYLVGELKIAPAHLILMGREMGAFVSCKISSQSPCKALILEEPWVTLKGWVDGRSPFFKVVPLSCYPEGGLPLLPLLGTKHPPVLIVSTSTYAPVRIFRAIAAPKILSQLDEMESVPFIDLHSGSRKYERKIEKLLAGESDLAGSSVKPGATQAASPIAFGSDLNAALAEAKAQKKLVMVDFYTDWCGWCKVLDRETYGNSEVQSFVNQNMVPVKINAEEPTAGKAAASKYKVDGYPTILILDSSGKVLKEIGGFVAPEFFLLKLQDAMEDNTNKN